MFGQAPLCTCILFRHICELFCASGVFIPVDKHSTLLLSLCTVMHLFVWLLYSDVLIIIIIDGFV